MAKRRTPTPWSDLDLQQFREGLHERLWERLGAHSDPEGPGNGTRFAIWAPGAEEVGVLIRGEREAKQRHALAPVEASGIWEGAVEGAGAGTRYRFEIRSPGGGPQRTADPCAFAFDREDGATAVVCDPAGYDWSDGAWLRARAERPLHRWPFCAYDVHVGSWRRVPEEGNRRLGYAELAPMLAEYTQRMGFTHVVLQAVVEHVHQDPHAEQPCGWFAPASRYGSPSEFMALVNTLHERGVGVLLDWPIARASSFVSQLGRFDGSPLQEEPGREGEGERAPGFDLERGEVRSFLLSSVLFWLETYHLDGIRLEGLAPLLAAATDEKGALQQPPRGFAFVQQLNERIHHRHPDALTLGDEWPERPLVSRSTRLGGCGFSLVRHEVWTRTVLTYLAYDPLHRKHEHHELVATFQRAFREHFLLALSGAETSGPSGPLVGRMFGDEWQRLANLRALLGMMYGHPGKKLLFMGNELASDREWSRERSLDWHLLDDSRHRGLQRWVRDLNTFVRGEPAMHELDFDAGGLDWVEAQDDERSVLAFVRWDAGRSRPVLCACNLTPVPRHNYRIGVPQGGRWEEALNGDAPLYGGSGQGNLGGVEATPVASHGQFQSLNVTLPPLAAVFFRTTRP